MISRRSLLAVGLAVTTGCRQRKASGYAGYAFVANQEGRAVAAVDLNVFALARQIHIDGNPSEVIADPHRPQVYALCPDNGSVHIIRTDTLSFARKLYANGTALSMRISPTGAFLYVACSQPHKLVAIELDTFRIAWQCALPGEPFDFHVDRSGQYMAISYGDEALLHLFPVANRNAGRPVKTAALLGAVRFQSDSRALVAANRSHRMLSFYQVPDPELIVNLPLSMRPDNLCFNSDGGQLFVTGEGSDTVVIVYPYYTPQVGETVPAGHAPGAMAATLSPESSPQYLFIANPQSGDVTILDIRKQRVVAVTPVGTDPCHITMTPDDRYALVLNRGSGDLAVIRVANTARAVANFGHSKRGPLFMMVPVGSRPVSAAIMPVM